MDEIEALCAEGANINEAKRVLAYTVTSQVHGEDEAKKPRKLRLRCSAARATLPICPPLRFPMRTLKKAA